MIRIFDDINVDWLSKRRVLIGLSVLIMLAGLASAIGRQAVPGGTDAFNLGVDFRGGTLVTVDFKQRPSPEDIRAALAKSGLGDSVIPPVLDKDTQVLVKLAQQGSAEEAQTQAHVDIGQTKIKEALATFGPAGKLSEGAAWE